MKEKIKPILGITTGDINGIGIEIILKTFSDKRMFEICTPIIFGSHKVLYDYKRSIDINDINFTAINNYQKINPKTINVFNCWEEQIKIELGKITKLGGKYALKSILASAKALKCGDIDILVTAPINKQNIQSKKFNFPGHTEFYEQQFNGSALMLMISDNLRLSMVTGHIPISEVSASINKEKILKKLIVLQTTLIQDFGIKKPKIAVLGLNPHASDDGLLGFEENKIIIPAIKEAADKNILVFGPYPADSFFRSININQFDGILAMYHDQALIPFKTISLDNGVNFTAGLKYIRTSPDHGTAFNIAGQNKANEQSFRSAVYSACDIYNKRKEFNKLMS